jgi:hypothetical protein
MNPRTNFDDAARRIDVQMLFTSVASRLPKFRQFFQEKPIR